MDFQFEDKDTTNNQKAANKRKRKTKPAFSCEEKKKLAGLVEERKSIWNLQDKGHSNTEAVNSDWRHIAREMEKSVDECKSTWKSLKDSRRYHTTNRKKAKSGSAADEIDIFDDEHILDDESSLSWEYSECLSFLTPASSKRTTFSSNTIGDPTISPASTNDTPSSSYTYDKEKQRRDPMLDNVALLTQSVSELVQLRREDTVATQPVLTNYALFANLDRIMKQLPEDVIEELGLTFHQQAMQELRKLKK